MAEFDFGVPCSRKPSDVSYVHRHRTIFDIMIVLQNCFSKAGLKDLNVYSPLSRQMFKTIAN
jgi:hypothetical protein